ncbi:MAG: response regulator [Candidatus Saganbacteria bacterium]|nr:response regulator [Candidatus Saganbacteria bacterium]
MAVKRILIVEDDEGMREIYADMFEAEKKQYLIKQVSNAKEALVLAQKETFDLIILDIIMEPLPGDSFFVRLRDNPKTSDIPVVIISVLSPDTLSKLKDIDHCSIIQKPVRKEQVLRLLEKHLGK